MRTDPCDWTAAEVAAVLARCAARGELDAARLARLAGIALLVAGGGAIDPDPLLAAYYPGHAKRVAAEARTRTFACIGDRAQRGVLRGDVLVNFLCGDADRHIVSAAAFGVACLDVAESAAGARGADLVLALVVGGSVRNTGAALGGLLALGNRDVEAKLRALRPALALPAADAALDEMARCTPGEVHASTVEFWLAWMEALAAERPRSQRVIDRAGDALERLRKALPGRVVIDGSRRLPAPRAGARYEPGAREVALGEFAASVAPRLSAVAAAAPGSAGARRALAAWGLRH
jgi:hypothetical protein